MGDTETAANTQSAHPLYEIDDYGGLTESQKRAIPEFFRLVPYGTKHSGPGYQPTATPDEVAAQRIRALKEREPLGDQLITYINNVTGGMAVIIDEETDASREKIVARDETCKNLRRIAQEYLEHGFKPDLFIEACEAYGWLRGCVKMIDRNSQIVNVAVDADGFASDLTIEAAGAGLKPVQQRMLVEVGKAWTVVRVVLARSQWSISSRMLNATRAVNLEQWERRKRDQYVRRLALIANAALREEDAGYAGLALDAFKNEFVAMEADAVKNQYVRKLGRRALLVAVAFGAAWALSVTWLSNSPFAVSASPFLFTAIGACAGTWLSFAIRRVVLGFNDLALLEDDRMNPLSRTFFVVGLTWLVGLFLESGVINAEVNGIRMNLGDSAMIGLLIGAMCGIAERALAGVVGKRSEEFVARLGQPTPKEA
jgi:hypothetical protein